MFWTIIKSSLEVLIVSFNIEFLNLLYIWSVGTMKSSIYKMSKKASFFAGFREAFQNHVSFLVSSKLEDFQFYFLYYHHIPPAFCLDFAVSNFIAKRHKIISFPKYLNFILKSNKSPLNLTKVLKHEGILVHLMWGVDGCNTHEKNNCVHMPPL